MDIAIPKRSAVYVRYLNQGLSQTLSDVVELETMGWLGQEIGQHINIQHDRTVESIQHSSGSGNGVIIPKNSIIDIHLVGKRESE
jgi:hypothetical protein